MSVRRAYLINAFANVYFAMMLFILGIYVLALGGSSVAVGVAYAVYNLMIFVSGLLAGPIIDRNMLKAIMYSGVAILFSGLVGMSIVTSISGVYVSIILVGFGAGFIATGLLVFVSHSGGQADANIYGKLISYSAIGSAIGGGLGYLILILGELASRELLGVRMIFLAYAFLSMIPNIYLIRRSQMTYTKREGTREEERLNLKAIGGALLATSFQALAQGITYPMIFPFLTERFHASFLIVALAYAPSGAAWLLFSRRAGSLLNRYGIHRRFALVTIISAAIVMIIPFSNSLILLSALWALEGLGLVLWNVVISALISKMAPKDVWGKSYGLQNATYYLPYALGAVVGGVVFLYYGVVAAFYLGALFFLLAPLPFVLSFNREPRGAGANTQSKYSSST